MHRLVHFEIHADDLQRAAKFYSELLGWTIAKWEGPVEYMLITTGPSEKPGINGGLMKRRGPRPEPGQPVNCYTCTAEVPDLDAKLAKADQLGAATAVPKMAVPGVGWLAYLVDTEGNIFGLMQPDPAAK